MVRDNGVLPMDFDEPLPDKGVRRGGVYDKTVLAFVASDKPHAKIGGEASVQSRYLGLRKAIVRLGHADEIAASRIAGEVWLVRKS